VDFMQTKETKIGVLK